jgi:hypothetical protein
MENSIQQASQIGTEESRGREEPQREQSEGSNAQLAASTGLRSTRATARHAEVSDGGTSSVSELCSLLKTHLASRNRPVLVHRPYIPLNISIRAYTFDSKHCSTRHILNSPDRNTDLASDHICFRRTMMQESTVLGSLNKEESSADQYPRNA